MSQAPGQLIPVNRCSLPTLSPHGSWFHDGPHHRCIAAVAPRRAGSARYPYPFWLGRAPAHSGWTEPPGRLPSCTRLPFTLPLGRCLRLSSPKSDSRRSAFILTAPKARYGPRCAPTRSQLRGVLRSARNPCSSVSSRTSWPPSSPAPGSLRHCAWVGAPFNGSYPAFRRCRLSSSRIPDWLGPLYSFLQV